MTILFQKMSDTGNPAHTDWGTEPAPLKAALKTGAKHHSSATRQKSALVNGRRLRMGAILHESYPSSLPSFLVYLSTVYGDLDLTSIPIHSRPCLCFLFIFFIFYNIYDNNII